MFQIIFKMEYLNQINSWKITYEY